MSCGSVWLITVTIASVTAVASPTSGQMGNHQPLPTTAGIESGDQTRLTELQEWILAYTKWKEWSDKWRGKVEPGWFGPRARRTKPDPPVWLSDYCRSSQIAEGDLAVGCRLLTEYQYELATVLVKERLRDERAQREAPPTRTKWWNHIHVDALWMTTRIPASYGVIGIHATLHVAGRLHFFVAPGAMLLNMPTRDGSREWKPATDLGISYQLFDLKFPGYQRMATVHLNLAKAWVVGHRDSMVDTSVDLAGLSFSFK